MLRTKPKFAYCGLTIVMSNQSRFDKHELLSATGGWFLNDKCLRPEYNRYQCDIRLKEDKSSFLNGTKCVLLLGEPAMRAWTGKIDNTIGEVRGSVYIINDVPHISSYLPQDCLDIKDYESDLNPLANRGDGYEEDDEEGGDEKRKHGFTSRKNFGFWLIKDIERCKHILEYGVPKSPEVNYVTYPRQELVEQILQDTKNNVLHFDIETDYEQQNMQCFSFGFNDSSTVYNIPCLLPDYSWAYTGLHKIYKSLAVAIRDNTLVAHNGHNFDFFVLGHKYRIPIGRKVFDTMIAHHRCWPDQEKSLGHLMSHLTWEPFHKDTDAPYSSLENARKKWEYCGRDIYGMKIGYNKLLEYAKTIPGLMDSINQAMSSIKPYLTTTLQGISYRQDILDKTMKENDRLMMQYHRMINMLVGEASLPFIRGKSLAPLPSSNVQCCRYFHDLLGYPVVARGQETKSGDRNPSLGKKALYKLRLNHDNPVIDISLLYRELAKESGSLKFTPWKI